MSLCCSSTTLYCRKLPGAELVEVVADKGKPVVVRFSDESTEQLGVCMDMAQAVSKLREAAGCGTPPTAPNSPGIPEDGTPTAVGTLLKL